MAKEEYDELAETMREIAGIIKEFPEELHREVFYELVRAFTDREEFPSTARRKSMRGIIVNSS